MGDVLEKEKLGLSCNDAIEEIGNAYLSLEAIKNYVPEGDVVLAYNVNCEMNFEGNQFIVNSQVTSGAFSEQYNGSSSPNVASFWDFVDDESGTITNAVGSTSNFTYKWDLDTNELTITIGGVDTDYVVSYDQFFTQVILTKSNGDILTLGFYGDKSLLNCELVEVLATPPCITLTQVQGILNRVTKGCPCNCEEYVNVQPADKSGEAILNVYAAFTCVDGLPYITVTFDYLGASEDNEFQIVAGSEVIYTFPSTGQSSGSVTLTITSDELQALANGYYDITIVDGTTTSNILTGIRKTSCET